jgi:hypothetical protein
VINNWNLDRGIRRQDETSIDWRAVTTGNYGGIDMWLENAMAGRLAFETGPKSGSVSLAELHIWPREFPAGGLERAIRVQRLPDVMTTRRLTLTRRVRIRGNGDTRLFVRVQQEDGHRIWTSPIYLFR